MYLTYRDNGVPEVMSGGASETQKELLICAWEGKDRMIFDPRKMGIQATHGKQLPNRSQFRAAPPNS